jgi:hypothetical protein
MKIAGWLAVIIPVPDGVDREKSAAVPGSTEIAPSTPCLSPERLAVMYRVSGSPELPAPKTIPWRPRLTMVFPAASFSVPRKFPVTESNALIVPSPKFPMRMALLNAPKCGLALATPHGALRGPLEAKRLTKVPSRLNMLTRPFPVPMTAVCLAASCRA